MAAIAPAAGDDGPRFTFVIPVKPRDRSEDWGLVMANLRATLASVLASRNPDFEVVIAAHDPLDIPDDPRIRVLIAPFGFSSAPKAGTADKRAKWRLMGADLRARGYAGYVMFLDADDLVHRRVVNYVRKNDNRRGYVFGSGYRYDVLSGNLSLQSKGFEGACGSCFVGWYETADLPRSHDDEDNFFAAFRHNSCREIAAAAGRPVDDMPFPAAVYLLNHPESMRLLKRDGVVRAVKDAAALPDGADILKKDFAFGRRRQAAIRTSTGEARTERMVAVAAEPVSARPPLPVTLFIADPERCERMRAIDPEIDWRVFGIGLQSWIGQTFQRLRALGCAVTLASEPPAAGLAVAHSDDVPALRRARRERPFLVVSVRADRAPNPNVDFEIVQNHASIEDPAREIYLPYWPQPALIPRLEKRGTTLRRLSFKGMRREISRELEGPDWEAFLRAHGLRWHDDTGRWKEANFDEIAWNDYAQVDLLVALRQPSGGLYPNKPATKLVNAWRAGVPAVLGPEIAYRELRRSELDYIEAANAAEVKAAVLRLRADPGLYRAMVANGRERAPEFGFDAVAARWRRALFETIPALAAQRTGSALHNGVAGG